MKILREIKDCIGACVVFAALGFTAFIVIVLSIKAHPGHHLEVLFNLPSHLGPYWMRIFCALWGFYWLALWHRLQRLMPDSEPVKKVYRVSWTVVISVAVLGYGLSNGKSHSFHQFLLNSGTKTLWNGISHLLGFTFPVLCLGTALLVAVDLGAIYFDPLERELHREINWKVRVNHAKFVKKALKKGMTYLGYEVTLRKPSFLSPQERNGHVHVVGTTGSGKTRYVLFPMIRQDIEAGRGVVFIDGKASDENARVIRKMVEDAGREKDFLYFSLSDLDRSRTYNPLQHGDASQLKDKVMAVIEWSEPYYKGLCRNALQCLFMDLARLGKRITLHELNGFLYERPGSLKAFSAIPEQDFKDISNLRNEIGSLVNTHFAGLLSQQAAEIDLLDVYRKGKIVYFALDTQSYQDTAAHLGRMIAQDLKTVSGIVATTFKRKDIRPLAVYIDEYQAFGTRGFAGSLAQGRESGFWITIAHQSLGDLKVVDPAYAQQINESTNTKIFLRINDPDSAQFFADSVGTIKTMETTRQVHLQGEKPKNVMGSQKVTREYLIHPSEIKFLKLGQAVFKCGPYCGRLVMEGFFDDTSNIELPLRDSPLLQSFGRDSMVPERNQVAVGEQQIL
jgi:conjugal transfer pilus assembly protein TraD